MRITRKEEEAMKKEIASLAIGAFLTGTAAFGQNTTTPVIDDRIINQEKRIHAGSLDRPADRSYGVLSCSSRLGPSASTSPR